MTARPDRPLRPDDAGAQGRARRDGGRIAARGGAIMHRLFPAIAAVGLALLLAACASGPTLRSDYDPAADFGRYRTFGYFSPLGTDKSGYSTLLTGRLKGAVRSQMEMRGYVYSEDAPDLLVNFSGKLQEKTEVSPAMPGPYYGYRAGFYGPWAGYAWDREVYRYTEGTLNIDLIDARSRQMVWEGVAIAEVDPGRIRSAQAVEKAVAEIFSRYPFRAGEPRPQIAPGR